MHPMLAVLTVRTTIKHFAKKRVTLPEGRHKIIILDEADSMTSGAQDSLRRTMEKFTSTTRFALACNESSKIIEPIQSRCAIVRFSKLSEGEILQRLQKVLQAEKISSFNNDGLEAIIFTSGGDMRNALNNLQSTFAGFGSITAENVYKVVDIPHPKHMTEVLQHCLAGKLDEAIQCLTGVLDRGYSHIDMMGTLFRVVKYMDMDEAKRLAFIREIASVHMRVAEGVATSLQLYGLLARMCLVTLAPPASSSAPSYPIHGVNAQDLAGSRRAADEPM